MITEATQKRCVPAWFTMQKYTIFKAQYQGFI